MLSPDQIETAGDAVAAVYNDIEARMLDHMVNTLIQMDNLDQKSMTELVLLAQTKTATLRNLIDERAEEISAEVRDAAERLINASDDDDMRRLGTSSPVYPQQIEATIEGIAHILERDNLKMVEGVKQAFLTASTEAVTRVNTGTMTTERALHLAVRKLERDGIPIITYQNRKTGVVTVENKVDVAVRRHIRTQIAQDGARMTMERIRRGECTLVEVSSHEDSRPSHAEWQGQVYSLNGDVEIDGHRYRDFYAATRYGSVDGLLGANCRHSFGPYRHGMPRTYEKDSKHPSGLPGSEVYELEQQQRYLERRIREAKRELRGIRQLYDAKPDDLGRKTALIKAQGKLRERQEAMRDLINEANAKSKNPSVRVLHRKPNREWAGDMPKSKPLGASGRKLDDFLSGAGASSTLKANGISKSAARKAIYEELGKRGGKPADFSSLSAKDQQSIFRSVIGALRKPSKTAGAKHSANASIDRTAPVYSKLETKHVDAVARLVGNGSSASARLYLRYERDLNLADHAYRRGAHFHPQDVAVRLDVARTFADKRQPSMNTWFHEFGHQIDYISTGAQNYAVKRALGISRADMYASTRYKGNLFGKTLKAEADAYVNATHARIKAEVSATLDALDLHELNLNHQLSDAAFQALRHKTREYKTVTAKDFDAEEWGMTAEEVKRAKGYKKEIVAAVKKDPQFKAAIAKRRAYQEVTKEIRALTDNQKGDLSDIFEGATGGRVNGGWGHGKSYWDSGNLALAKEAFAEFYSAHISSPESLAILRQYLPKSAAMFEDIIEAIEKGTI